MLAWNLYADENDGKIVRGDIREHDNEHPGEIPWVEKDWPQRDFTDDQIIQAIKAGAFVSLLQEHETLQVPERFSS